MKKTHKVVMLSTEKAGVIWKFDASEKLIVVQGTMTSDIPFKNFHLYIISDEEIKDDDWFIDRDGVFQRKNSKLYSLPLDAKKIVATTDFLMLPLKNKIDSTHPRISQLPESFIQAYIKAYNEGKPITEVDLEMEVANCANIDVYNQCDGHKHTFKIKTRPDNTVIVHQSKMYTQAEYDKALEQIGQMQLEMYTKDEVTKLLNNYRHFAQTGNLSIEMMEKWIQHNL